MKKRLSTILLILAVLMPTALWAQGIAGDSTAVAAPTFRFEGDLLYIETATEGASIFYRMEELPNMDEATIDKISSDMTVTADGQQSIYYHEPIEITKSVIIKAIAASATVSEVSTLVYDYYSWIDLLKAVEYGTDVYNRAQNNEKVDSISLSELAWMLDEAKMIYGDRAAMDSYEAQHFSSHIMEIAHQIEEKMNSVNETEAYVVLSGDDKGSTLTFYYDDQKENREGWMPMGQDGTNITWTNYAQGITKVIFDESFASCRPTSTAYWFSGFNNLVNIEGIENLKTDSVTNMSNMFYNCTSLTSLDVSGFNTANVEDMGAMFYNCFGLTSLDLSNFKTDNVTDMSMMFAECYDLTSLDLSNFKTDNVTNMKSMFFYCSSLTNLDLSGFNTANVTDMSSMFVNCSALTSLDLSSFNTSNVTDMQQMFRAVNLSTLPISGFNTSKVTTMSGMFVENQALASIDISHFDTSNVTDMSFLFNNCHILTDININGLNTSNVTNMSFMFNECYALESVDVSGLDTKNVENMEYMFAENPLLKTIYVGEKWTTASVTQGDKMFYASPSIVGGAGTQFAEDRVDYTYAHIDGGPDNPGYFTEKNAPVISDDIIQFADANVKAICVSNWDANGDGELSKAEAAAVTDLGEVFKENTEITSFNELVNFTGLSAIGDYAFSNCNNLQEVTMPQTITRIGHDAFNRCSKMVSADIPSGVTEIDYQAFYGCSSLTSFVIPDGVTFITYNAFTGTGITSIVPAGYEKGEKCGVIPESVTKIATQALLCHNLVSVILPAGVQELVGNPFVGCNALQILKVEDGSKFYHAEGNCIIETATNTVSVGCNKSIIPSYAKHIGENAFCNLNFVEFEVPEGIISVEKSAFNNSFYLEEVTLPSTLENLSEYAFYACRKLTTLKVKMSNPIEIGNIFAENALNTLYVPSGTAEKYRNAEWWKNFENIFEMEADVNYSFDYNGVLWVDSDVTMAQVLEEASKMHNVAEHITAIVWHSSQPLTNSDLQVFDNPNMLIYVASDSLAPQNRNNVVVGDFAKNIVLKDVESGNGNFYCPQEFTAEMISYTHEYKQKTEVGVSRGWETIALPFDVQTITHEKYGPISPFGRNDGNKHFWLRQLEQQGLTSADKIQAQLPYLISMPNSESYSAAYNLAGRVTFSTQNVVVRETLPYGIDGEMVTLWATFSGVSKSAGVYALNVGEARGNNPEGSVFEVNYRDIRPFEAYTMHEGNGPAPQFIPVAGFTDGEATGIEDVRSLMSDDSGENWYDLNGRKLLQKPIKKGVYLNNGHKVVIR